jgi:hypothetical protein
MYFETSKLEIPSMKNRSPVVIAILLMLSIGNYYRIVGNENVRLVQFLSIAAIGALAALLIQALVKRFRP